VVAVLLFVVGPVRTDHDQQHCYHYVPNIRSLSNAAAVDRLLMLGIRMPETCSAVFKRHAIKLLLIAASSCVVHLNLNYSTGFGRSFRPSSGVQDCTYIISYMSYRLADCMLAGTR
jgi:hypothetical protein